MQKWSNLVSKLHFFKGQAATVFNAARGNVEKMWKDSHKQNVSDERKAGMTPKLAPNGTHCGRITNKRFTRSSWLVQCTHLMFTVFDKRSSATTTLWHFGVPPPFCKKIKTARHATFTHRISKTTRVTHTEETINCASELRGKHLAHTWSYRGGWKTTTVTHRAVITTKEGNGMVPRSRLFTARPPQ